MIQKAINQTFFDAILMADSERVHSQMLAWILNLPEQQFPFNEKATLLQKLFLFEKPLVINSIQVFTEINHIDIQIELDQHILIIENKLKSSEHSNQTIKYIETVSREYNNSGKTLKFAFITLIGEEPKNNNWNVISFENLFKALDNINWNDKNRESLFIKEYIQTLNNLVVSFKTFVENHQDFDSVFNDGYKSKHNKVQHQDTIKEYIRVNQLETIFKKALLKEVSLLANLKQYYIAETRGTALIQIFVDCIIFENKEYHLGLQFQGTCLKINLILQTKTKSKIPDVLKDYFGNTFSKKNEYNRFNRNNSNPYISVSKNLQRQLYEMNKIEIAEVLKKELDFIKSNLDSFKSQLIKQI